MAVTELKIKVDSRDLDVLSDKLIEVDRDFLNLANSADGAGSATATFARDSSRTADQLDRLNRNVSILTSLNLASTLGEIGGSLGAISSGFGSLKDYLADVAATANGQFSSAIAGAGSSFAGLTEALSGTLGVILSTSAAIAQLVTLFAGPEAVLAGLAAGWAAFSGAIGAWVSFAGIAITSIAAGLGVSVTVLTGGLALVVAAVAALGYAWYRTGDAAREAAREQERLAEEIRVEIQARTDAYERLKDELRQVIALAIEDNETVSAGRIRANALTERSIELAAQQVVAQREALGIYAQEEEQQSLLAQARLAYMQEEETQRRINIMLGANMSEVEALAFTEAEFLRISAGMTADELRLWVERSGISLDAFQRIKSVVIDIKEEAGKVADRLFAWFNRGDTKESDLEEQTNGITRGITRAADALKTSEPVIANKTDALTRSIQELYVVWKEFAILASDKSLWGEIPGFQQAQDRAAADALKESQRIFNLRMQANERLRDQARDINRDLERERSAILERTSGNAAALFGSGDISNLSKEMKNNLADMSEDGAASLGVLNGAMNDMAGGFGQALGSALMSGERVDKALKKALAGVLSSLGQTYLAQGAALLIPPPFNPLGNPAAGGVMLGVGGLMLGLSAAFGGIGGGGGGGKKSPSVAASTTPGSNQTTYTSVSFGFVGDRRAAGREVADVQENANRRGY